MSEIKKPKRKINTGLLEEYRSLLSDMTAPLDPKLTEITLLDDMDDETYQIVAPILISCYESESEIQRRLGSIFNACYTQQLSVFVLTKDLADELVKKDPHYQPNSCNTEAYKKVKSLFLTHGIIEELRKPVRNDYGVQGKSGLYRLSHKKFRAPLIQLAGDAVLQARDEHLIKWFDEKNPDQVEETPEILAERRKAREIADEIFKRK